MCFHIPDNSYHSLIVLTDILVYKYLCRGFNKTLYSPYQGTRYFEGKMKTSQMRSSRRPLWKGEIEKGLHCFYAPDQRDCNYYGYTQFKMTVPKGATFWIDPLRKEIVTNRLYFGVTKSAQRLTQADIRDMMRESLT